jgi:hypothetical protein
VDFGLYWVLFSAWAGEPFDFADADGALRASRSGVVLLSAARPAWPTVRAENYAELARSQRALGLLKVYSLHKHYSRIQ